MQKAKIETITFASGLISSLASSTGYFLGVAGDQFGPILTLGVSLTWIAFFFYIILSEKEEEPEAIWRDAEKVGKPQKDQSQKRWGMILLVPWGLTFAIWISGVVIHEQMSYSKDLVCTVEGVVIMNIPDNEKFYNRLLDQVTVSLEYQGQTMEMTTGSDGYFRFEVDLDPRFSTVYLTFDKDHYQKIQKKPYTVDHITHFSVPTVRLSKLSKR